MDKTCETCFFYDERSYGCRNNLYGLPLVVALPTDTCEDWTECEYLPERKEPDDE